MKGYSHLSNWGKALVCLMLFYMVVTLLKRLFTKPTNRSSSIVEGFEQQDALVVKTNQDLYDDLYAGMYDYLVYNQVKNEYELDGIMEQTGINELQLGGNPGGITRILDVGCGTGHHVAALMQRLNPSNQVNHASNQVNQSKFDSSPAATNQINWVEGVDKSESMIAKAKQLYPQWSDHFRVGDALDYTLFQSNDWTHIMCLYFTLYYMKDKTRFFQNAYRWLKPGGYLAVHIVDKQNFDTLLQVGNPLLYISPQRYVDQSKGKGNRITRTKAQFDSFNYVANFHFGNENNKTNKKNNNQDNNQNNDNNQVLFVEKLTDEQSGKVRRNEHTLYMEEESDIVDMATNTGFIMHAKIDLLHCQYEYQYVYLFVKPN